MNIANFDLNLLRVFDALMTEHNVTRAAQIVFLSQPAVSHALSRLRSELGDPLFVRAGRTMIPTPRAISLHAAVRTALDQLTAALGESRFDRKTSTAIFRVGTLDLGEYVFAPLFGRLMKEAPSVRFVVQTFDDANYPGQLASGELDMVITMAVARGPGIHAKRLGTYPLVAVVRNGHELTRGRVTPRRFMELPRLAIMARADQLDWQADRLLGEARIGGKVVYATPHHAAAPVLLMNSDLLMVTTEIVAKILCAQFPLTIVQLPVQLPPIESHIIWHERTHHDPAQQWLRGEIGQHAADLTEEAARKR